MAGIGNESASIAAAMEVKGVGMPTPTLEKQIAMENKEPFAPQLEVDSDAESDLVKPSEADLDDLRRVPARIPWIGFTIAFVELCERFAYYGTTVVSTFVFRASTLDSLEQETHLSQWSTSSSNLCRRVQRPATTLVLMGSLVLWTLANGRRLDSCCSTSSGLISYLCWVVCGNPHRVAQLRLILTLAQKATWPTPDGYG